MIISASRRTDIPAFFSEWFFKRIQDEYAYVRNPMNIHQVSKIDLSPQIVDCIVFWSKNPQPMIKRLDELKNYMYYFQFTLNAYEKDIETNLPQLDQRIETFQTLAKIIGRERIIWRYDPIIVNQKYSIKWHQQQFNYIASKLSGYTDKVTISFIDLYTKISANIRGKEIYELNSVQKESLAESLSACAHKNNMYIDTCAEDIDLSKFDISHARCIDDKLIGKLLGCSMDVDKDKNQRLECGCVASIDLGLYNTCQNGCAYCYANHNLQTRLDNFQKYNPNSPILCSELTDTDKISERKVKSQKNMQLSFFDMVE